MPRANMNEVINFILPIPQVEEQKQIVKLLGNLREQTQSLESKYQQELNSLEELKKSILQKAFEGEL
jgi:type I restriction enzyme S subunit